MDQSARSFDIRVKTKPIDSVRVELNGIYDIQDKSAKEEDGDDDKVLAGGGHRF